MYKFQMKGTDLLIETYRSFAPWIVTRLSLDEEALCVVTHAEQISTFRIGG